MENSIIFETIGFIAGICTAIVFLPQSIQTLKSKNTKELSLLSYIIYNLAMVCWIIYGWYLNSIQMIVFNTISFVFSIIILYLIVKNRKIVRHNLKNFLCTQKQEF